MADEDLLLPSWSSFHGIESPADRGVRSKQTEEVRRHHRPFGSKIAIRPGEVEIRIAKRGQLLEGTGLSGDIGKISGSEGLFVVALAGPALAQQHQAINI